VLKYAYFSAYAPRPWAFLSPMEYSGSSPRGELTTNLPRLVFGILVIVAGNVFFKRFDISKKVRYNIAVLVHNKSESGKI